VVDIRQAVQAYHEGRFADAERLCRQILAASPGQWQASLILGRALVSMGRAAEAEELTADALASNRGQPDLLTLRGEVLARHGRKAEAIACATEAIDRRFNNPRAHAVLSALLAELRDPTPRFSVSVITPSAGSPRLAQAIESVQAQTYPLLEHLVVADGPEHHDRVHALLPAAPRHPVQYLALPLNTGGDGYCGHRVYGAAPYLVNSHYIAFLDEDNWFDPDHVSSLMAKITADGLAWAYALRKIVDSDGQFLTNDDCESLGAWPTWNDPNNNLVDVNCYMLRRDLAIAVGPLWYRRFRDEENPDFAICRQLLRDHPRCGTNGLFSVNYRIGSTADSVQAAFFLSGNAVMQQRFKDRPPWRTKTGT
jgi:tetratricopeptide (TPR) repeat protein